VVVVVVVVVVAAAAVVVVSVNAGRFTIFSVSRKESLSARCASAGKFDMP
jgi:hypothetical protein